MIRRITRITNAGLFRAWRPDSNTPEFQRVNVLYGANGSGKSTLARLFQSAAASGADPIGLELTVDDPSGGSRQVTAGDDGFWKLVRVFNKEYVERSLRFDREGKSDAAPLLVLGEEQVDREAQLKQSIDRIDVIEAELATLEPAYSKSQSRLKKLATDTAKQIVEELQVAGNRYQGRRYTAAQIQTELAPDRNNFEHKSTDVAGDLQLVQGRQLSNLEPPAKRDRSVSSIDATVASLLAKTVTSTTLDELRNEPEVANWVQQGIDLHEHKSDCRFCGGPLSQERRLQLESHFDQGLRQLQTELAAAELAIEERHGSAGAIVPALPNSELLYDELRDEYRKIVAVLKQDVTAYQERLAALSDGLQRKRDALFSVLELPTLKGPTDLELSHVAAIISRHNQRSADFRRTVDEAARRVELSRLADMADEYRRIQDDIQAGQDSISKLKQERSSLQRQHSRLNEQRLDPGPLADELTRDVATLLGRSELTFELRDSRYVIERNGAPALGLSEGEKTAISLLYFLCSLREEPTRDQEAIVIIDDPVSSLDQDVLVGASGHIWSALVSNESKHQMFLLTHSFELFRMWSNQLDRLPPHLKSLAPNLIGELRVRSRADTNGKAIRRPVLIPWTDKKLRKALRSQYHYLFWRVGSTVQEAQEGSELIAEVEAASIIPNAARKMLEAFLAFRYPGSIGDFDASMRRAVETVPDPLRQRVTRFLHRQSHNEDADLSRSVETGEALAVLMSVFELIKEVDDKHYGEMCSSLGLDGEALAPPRP